MMLQNKVCVGCLPGEGIGPELVEHCRNVGKVLGLGLEWEEGGEIGVPALERCGSALSPEVRDFCSRMFSRRAPILSGPGGARYVYDLRRAFSLRYKVNPIRTFPALTNTTPLRSRGPGDVLVVRETFSGLYHAEEREADEAIVSEFTYSRADVTSVMRESVRLAARRRGRLAVVFKPYGQPRVSRLWSECARAEAEPAGVEWCLLEPDLCAYQMLHDPSAFDVMVTSNDLGDILSDLGGLLMGSRGMTYGACYTVDGVGVYQTNHGSAHDLRGRDVANPAGQLLSFAMLLREDMSLPEPARRLEEALDRVWRRYRTADLASPECETVGTTRFVAELIQEL